MVIVHEQSLIRFIIGGHYLDYVWCDVIPIVNACRLLLGRPWQFDRGVIYNGQENSYTIQVSNLTDPFLRCKKLKSRDRSRDV